eukprot:CAMPEP_0184977976 /NCGR_PEP_ID=MMETSP1098-20130426/8613_1 /TAXON_ID=89044 /ORGANISM="Spumella elongata, Strain CCAP 955/1" /LENGTH=47 /DNA_ID= /DNA_START= /DNA_END= /DNA_ORIENTATION=
MKFPEYFEDVRAKYQSLYHNVDNRGKEAHYRQLSGETISDKAGLLRW